MGEFNSFSLLVTENCNLACKYCYEVTSVKGHRNVVMSEDTARAAVDFMFKSAKSSPKIAVTLFGGEPTLMPNIIDIVCNRGKELAIQHNKKFKVSMITNATIMNDKLHAVLTKHLDIWETTQLSIDGPAEIQDKNRITKDGSGSFHLIEKNFPIWKKLYGDTLSIHGVLRKDTIPELYNIFLYFKEQWRENKLWFMPETGIGNEYSMDDVVAYDVEMEKIYKYIMNEVREQKSIDPILAYAPLDRALNSEPLRKPCGAGSNYGTITTDGSIFPCHHFYFTDKNRETYLGNIYDGVDANRKRIWDDYDAHDLIGCEGCEHHRCYRCIAENLEVYGNPFMQICDYSHHCDIMKVDFKYQKLIKEEISAMGLMNKNNEEAPSCDLVVRDCVGKIGACEIVTRTSECKFDRIFEEVEEAPSLFKKILDKIIGFLVNIHNTL